MKEFKYIIKGMQLFAIALIIGSCEKMLDPDESGNLVPKTVDLDPDLPSIQVNGTFLHAETFGDITNPIVIFIPGGPGSDYCQLISKMGTPKQSRYPNKRTIGSLGLDQLQDEFYCVFFDPRGAGLSPRFDKGTLTIDLYHKDLNAIIDFYLQKKFEETGLQNNKVYLAGHSFGGLYVTSFVNKYPEKIEDIILLEPTPLTKEIMEEIVQTSVFSMVDEEWLNQYLYSLDHISYDDHCRMDYHRILGYSESFPEMEYPEDAPLWRYGTAANSDLEKDTYMHDDYNITSNLINFEGRTLFIRGGKTHALPVEVWNEQMTLFPVFEEAIIPNTGHLMLWENPDLTAQYIRTFLNN